MNILLIDDDIPYIKNIYKMIDWNKLTLDSVMTAYSSQEAMEILETNQISIVMTDIEMPVMTGLDLILWCRQHQIPSLFIILSSFPDFSYAQRAVSYGVFEYLLKTSDSVVLENVIQRAVHHLLHQDAEETPSSQTRLNHQTARIQYYIEEHITEEISRDDIAEYVGFSPEYLSSFFKKEKGCTLSDYITTKKIEFSKQLLLRTDLPVSIIAQNIGFCTSSYFTALFKKQTGDTPRQFRKKHMI